MRDIDFKITNAEEGAALLVSVVPNATRNEVVGKHGDALKVNLTTATVSGIANDTLITFFGQKLGVDRENVEIVAGLASIALFFAIFVDVAKRRRGDATAVGRDLIGQTR